MEMNRAEVKVIEDVVELAGEAAIKDLRDVELVLVGGGNGTVIFG